MSCPNDDAIAAFVEGQLAGVARGELIAHLDTCIGCRRLVGDAVLTGGDVVAPNRSTTDAFADGSVVCERWRIEGVLGRGGWAVVYAARHVVLGTPVALKVLTGELDPKSLARFAQEAQFTASMTSEHVVRVLDFSERPPILVMERLPGETLARRLARDGALPLAAAVRIAIQIIDALVDAHALGLVHRDIKPSNVFLCEHPNRDHVKVLDFGIAKAFAEEHGIRTTTGSLLGTPPYMTPEQLLAARVDARTDIHAVGSCMYEMLTGRGAFSRDRIRLVREILADARPDVRALRPEVPTALGAIVTRAFARRPEDRFQSAAEMRAALGALAANDARPSPSNRRRTFAIAVGAGAVGGAIIAALAHTSAPMPVAPASSTTTSSSFTPATSVVAPIASSASSPTTSATSSSPPTPSSSGAARPPASSGTCSCRDAFGNHIGKLCPEPQPPVCTCASLHGSGAAYSLCPAPQKEGACPVALDSYGGAGRTSGAPCEGYWPTTSGKDTSEKRAGKLECSICNRDVHRAGKRGDACRGIDFTGAERAGVLLCP